MHTVIDYGDLEGQNKIDRAISDIKFYLGEEKYEELCETWKEEAHKIGRPIPFGMFSNMLRMFLGIEGYPVIAWATVLGPEYVKGVTE